MTLVQSMHMHARYTMHSFRCYAWTACGMCVHFGNWIHTQASRLGRSPPPPLSRADSARCTPHLPLPVATRRGFVAASQSTGRSTLLLSVTPESRRQILMPVECRQLFWPRLDETTSIPYSSRQFTKINESFWTWRPAQKSTDSTIPFPSAPIPIRVQTLSLSLPLPLTGVAAWSGQPGPVHHRCAVRPGSCGGMEWDSGRDSGAFPAPRHESSSSPVPYPSTSTSTVRTGRSWKPDCQARPGQRGREVDGATATALALCPAEPLERAFPTSLPTDSPRHSHALPLASQFALSQSRTQLAVLALRPRCSDWHHQHCACAFHGNKRRVHKYEAPN